VIAREYFFVASRKPGPLRKGDVEITQATRWAGALCHRALNTFTPEFLYDISTGHEDPENLCSDSVWGLRDALLCFPDSRFPQEMWPKAGGHLVPENPILIHNTGI